MSDNKTPYDEIPDLEIVTLRKRIQELESRLSQAQAVLRENDLLDEKSYVSAEEGICISQIAKYEELDQKNIPFQLEDVKTFEILVKCLLAIRGKSAPVEAKKKETKVDIQNLLKIAGNKKFTGRDDE